MRSGRLSISELLAHTKGNLTMENFRELYLHKTHTSHKIPSGAVEPWAVRPQHSRFESKKIQ